MIKVGRLPKAAHFDQEPTLSSAGLAVPQHYYGAFSPIVKLTFYFSAVSPTGALAEVGTLRLD